MKTPTSAELAFLRRRAEQTFQRMPVLPRREDGRMTPESRLRFELSMESILENNRTLGACVVLRRPSGQYDVFCHGTARLSGRVPVTEETCFRIASVSKLVMAFGVLALCERGALNLDEDLSVYLGYPVRNPHFKDVPVTLRMLLTHTAAIRDEGNYGTRGMQKGCTLRELLENVDNWLNAKPGEAFHYSNLGAGAAGVVMERAAEKPLDDIMQDLVFSPLAIRASYDPRRISPRSDLANGYSMRFPLPLLKYNAQALAKRKPEPFDPERDYLCAAGRLITDSRGMAALLLDNEAEAVTYQRAALSEILKDHAAACGVAWEPRGEVYGTGEYAVASGSSRWKAIEGFARRCGLTPYFTREGVLCLRGAAEGRRLVLEEPEGVIEASYRDRRYGVLSEVTAVNRAKKLRQTVRNEAFLARGGSCRRVVYVPSRSVNELRYTGRYQIEKSAEDARELTVTLTGSVDAEPMDRVELSLARLGVRGTFRVSETLHTLSASGETTELTLWEV